jgi:hypothetical protein
MDIAILPVLKESVSTVISCIMDVNAFGHHEIANIFVTGCFLKIQQYNDIYHYTITAEMEKEFKRLIREKTYKTKFDLLIVTTNQEPKIVIGTPFCYDVFTKGELRVVASTTHIFDSKCDDVLFSLSNSGRSSLLVRGEALKDKRIRIDVHSKSEIYDVGLCKRSKICECI